MINNKKDRMNAFILIALALNLIICYTSLIIYIFLLKFQELIKDFSIYSYSKYLITFAIVIVAKLIISGYLIHFFFNTWFKKEEKHYSDIPFLLGLFFYLFNLGKLIEFIMYVEYFDPNIFFSDFITLVRYRFIFGILTVLPLYIIGLYLYIYKRNLDKSYQEIRKIIRKFTLIFLTIFFIFWYIFINFFDNYLYIRFIMLGLSVSFFLISWIFFEAHRGKILKNINCFMISIGFFLYTLSQVTLPFSALILMSLIVDGEIISVIIMEIFSLISFIIILLGFKRKKKIIKRKSEKLQI